MVTPQDTSDYALAMVKNGQSFAECLLLSSVLLSKLFKIVLLLLLIIRIQSLYILEICK